MRQSLFAGLLGDKSSTFWEKGNQNMTIPTAPLVEGMSCTGCENNIWFALTSLDVGYRMVGS